MEKETISFIKRELSGMENLEDPRLIKWKSDERKGVKAAVQALHRKIEKKKKEEKRQLLMMRYEQEAKAAGARFIAGIDEAGRGPLAGPVVAAACILPDDVVLTGLNDSKKLSESMRESLYTQILFHARVGIGIINAEEIDQINIYEAAKKAMTAAVENLPQAADYLLVDAMKLPSELPQLSIIKGDAKSASIAAASIVAKVTRDRLMKKYAGQYPHYGFEQNMGYGTKKHLEALEKHGITPQHRKTFAPVKAVIDN